MVKKLKLNKRLKIINFRGFNPLNFRKTHTFFWDMTKFSEIIDGIVDYNELKLNENEILYLRHIINELNKKNNNSDLNKKYPNEIEILPLFKDIFDTIENYNIPNKSNLTEDIKNIIQSYEPSNTFYIKDLQKDMLEKKNKRISYSRIYKIIKKKLKYRFLNTQIKNKNLETNKSKIMSFIFIKIFLRAIQMKIIPIYIDETGFMIENNCYKRWRQKKEEFNIGPNTNKKKRTNLILAISSGKVILDKFVNGSINQKIFREFLKDLFEKIKSNKNQKYIIVMDNATIHKTKNIIRFCLKKKLKILTITPYYSKLNMIEYLFGFIKNKIYKKVYKNINELLNHVKAILNSDKINLIIQKLYKHTLQNYLDFINVNIDKIDLNNVFNNLNIDKQ